MGKRNKELRGIFSSILNNTIVLTINATPANWTITSHSSATNPQIVGTPAAESLTIDANNDGNADVAVKLTGTWNKNYTITLYLTEGTSISSKADTIFAG